MDFKRYFFIVNPISGTWNKEKLVRRIRAEFEPIATELRIEYTRGPSHAMDLALEALEEEFEVIAAVGGDGTVNETASALIHSNAHLAILPLGSGNGLSRHLGIPNNPYRALRQLKDSVSQKIDVCTANNIPFFNVAGVGYDALVAHDFAEMPGRGFWTYLRSASRNWRGYKVRKYRLLFGDEEREYQALAISFANGSQFGNNFYIAPGASMRDGLIDISIIRKFPGIALPGMLYQMMSRGIEKSPYFETLRLRDFTVKQKKRYAHLDGEPFELGKKIHFSVLPQALNILAPKEIEDAEESEYTLG